MHGAVDHRLFLDYHDRDRSRHHDDCHRAGESHSHRHDYYDDDEMGGEMNRATAVDTMYAPVERSKIVPILVPPQLVIAQASLRIRPPSTGPNGVQTDEIGAEGGIEVAWIDDELAPRLGAVVGGVEESIAVRCDESEVESAGGIAMSGRAVAGAGEQRPVVASEHSHGP